MAITVYPDIILPDSLIFAEGVSGRSERRNQRAVNQGGYMQINAVWQASLRRYNLGSVPMTPDRWALIEGIFEATEGGAYGFLTQDPKDREATVAEGLMRGYTTADVGTAGTGYGVPTYHFLKRYTAYGSTRTKDRRITRLKAGYIPRRGGTPLVAGTNPGEYAITETGALTFVADTSLGMSSITTGASTVLNFASGVGLVASLAIGQRVYVSGVTGTGASALNGSSHLITGKGATSLTVSTSTSGLTLAAGTAYKYPQASETLTWSGEFYVPVHFESDVLDWELVRAGEFDRRLVGSSSMLAEIREA
jgi:hypothetical protein